MPSVTPTREECIAKIATLTNLTTQQVVDLLKLPLPALTDAMQEYADQDWTKPGNTLDDVVAALGVLATVAGDLTGIGGLVQLLRGA